MQSGRPPKRRSLTKPWLRSRSRPDDRCIHHVEGQQAILDEQRHLGKGSNCSYENEQFGSSDHLIDGLDSSGRGSRCLYQSLRCDPSDIRFLTLRFVPRNPIYSSERLTGNATSPSCREWRLQRCKNPPDHHGLWASMNAVGVLGSALDYNGREQGQHGHDSQ